LILLISTEIMVVQLEIATNRTELTVNCNCEEIFLNAIMQA